MYILSKKLQRNNSLFLHVNDNMIERLNANLGNLPGTLNIFSTMSFDYASDTYSYVRNTGCWLYGIDMTGISISLRETRCGGIGGYLPIGDTCSYGIGHLITPKHIICANHYALGPGAKIKFVNNNNQTISRTIVAYKNVVGGNDTGISELDTPVTFENDGINIIKFLPSNYIEKLEKLRNKGIIIVQSNQLDRFMVGGLGYVGTVTSVLANPEWIYSQYNGYRNGICSADVPVGHLIYGTNSCIGLAVGDSGHGLFMVINNTLSLMGHNTSFDGPTFFGSFLNLINNTLKSSVFSGNYDIQLTNLDNFQNFI